ncbi:16S rRNA (guanine(966)-N(2))-methyltransferase RsmD [Winogradskya consettensis]|uniref:DNA methylase n=1 Tax=Winogradskya consettensis TaxID=113560 RepID=A0A919SBL1_9ACTN|nr:16S rRNA (guanine(966)-N(2))-methyltransferase RsmD [Actinoplanes consettensis]GIM68609.1 DNA methylase [Actinoplanes consettensis]
MTRIIAGAHGGRRLAAPPGDKTRPTSDRVREAYFSALDTMIDLSGARFADLYSGSGAVGLEALSRGAAYTLLVEADAKAARAIRDNIVTLRVGNAARLITGKVGQVLAGPPEGGPFDVIFADPPYAVTDDEVEQVQQALVANGWLAGDAVVTFERSSRTAVRGEPMAWVEGITADRSRRYGETTLWYGRRS